MLMFTVKKEISDETKKGICKISNNKRELPDQNS
jgi:hypothetical protein